MKITLLFPEYPNKGGFPLAPPILEYMAALTDRFMPEAEIRLIDANRTPTVIDDVDADLLGISLMTPSAPWGYRLADQARARGIKTVLGGIHPSAMPEEAKQHADSVVIGEAESIWEALLIDGQHNQLKPFYHGERIPLTHMPTPLYGALPGHYPFRGVFTARGCVQKCSFCSVRLFFGDTVRFRPIEAVVRDVAAIPSRIYYNGDDTIWGPDMDRSIHLFKALAAGPKKWWFGQGDLITAQRAKGDEMLKWAYRSGLRSVWVGYESENENILASYNALTKQGKHREETLRRIQDAGMEVVLFIILGGREGTLSDFERAKELSDRLKLTIHPVLLTPYPATELYEQYNPYLREALSWESYDGVHAIFDHEDPEMTPYNREEAVLRLNRDLFTWARIRRRTTHINRKGFPVAHLVAFMKQMAMRRGFNRAYETFCSVHG